MSTVGVLALQGDFARHQAVLATQGYSSRIVRYPADLDDLDALIIPGGESTTMSKQLDRGDLRDAVTRFGRERPVMGTCAGLILMAKEPSDGRVHSLNLLDVVVKRNDWGRQVHSFTTPLTVQLNGQQDSFPAIFIRAPRIRSVGPGVDVLARMEGEPVLVRQGLHMGVSFHPELTGDARIHKLFLSAFVA